MCIRDRVYWFLYLLGKLAAAKQCYPDYRSIPDVGLGLVLYLWEKLAAVEQRYPDN